MKRLTFAVAFALVLLVTPAAHAGGPTATVPEPGTLLMLGPGLFALGGLMIKLRKR